LGKRSAEAEDGHVSEDEDSPRARAGRQILTRGDWDRAVADGRLTAQDVLNRLTRMALHEFGESPENWPIAFDEEGFVTALIAEGILMEGGVTLRVCTRDHPPPHVHIQRRGEEDIKVNLENGAVEGPLPRGVRPKQLEKFSGLVKQKHELLCDLWLKNHGTAAKKFPPPDRG
jgi:Domain of unknown function (DUF4160)